MAIGALSASSGTMRQPRSRLESASRCSRSPETTMTGRRHERDVAWRAAAACGAGQHRELDREGVERRLPSRAWRSASLPPIAATMNFATATPMPASAVTFAPDCPAARRATTLNESWMPDSVTYSGVICERDLGAGQQREGVVEQVLQHQLQALHVALERSRPRPARS